MMILRDEQNIREVIALPMNQSALYLMMSALSEATIQQLKELHITSILNSANPGEFRITWSPDIRRILIALSVLSVLLINVLSSCLTPLKGTRE